MDVLAGLLLRIEKSVITYFFERDAFNSLILYLSKKNICACDLTAENPQHDSKQMRGI